MRNALCVCVCMGLEIYTKREQLSPRQTARFVAQYIVAICITASRSPRHEGILINHISPKYDKFQRFFNSC